MIQAVRTDARLAGARESLVREIASRQCAKHRAFIIFGISAARRRATSRQLLALIPDFRALAEKRRTLTQIID